MPSQNAAVDWPDDRVGRPKPPRPATVRMVASWYRGTAVVQSAHGFERLCGCDDLWATGGKTAAVGIRVR